MRPVLVVENDPFPRLIRAFLDAEPNPERDAAIADFVAHDIPDYPGWLAGVRRRAGSLFPAEVRLVSDQAGLAAALPGAWAVVTESLTVGAAELAAADRLAVVQKYGTVLRNIDAAACAARGVAVRTLRRRANIGTAEHAFALMLALAKKLNELDGRISLESLHAAGFPARDFDRRYTSSSNWARAGGLRTLHGTTLGIVGLGEIGREVATRAAAFGMRVLYTQRTRLPEADEQRLGVAWSGFDDLLAASDWVQILVPGNDGTRNLFDRAQFARMKPGAGLVNVSRAFVVERSAVREALESGRLAGYGVDTFYEEPGRTDDPLLQLRNVIVTPRTAAQPRHNAFGDLDELITALGRLWEERT